MNHAPMLFKPLNIKGLELKNRITMAPMYVGYANKNGTVSPLLLEHYRDMAASGAAMIVVENAAIDPSGLEAPSMLRVDDDEFIPGLARLAKTIHDEGALAFLQINHAGRYAFKPNRIAPSPLKVGSITPIEMSERAIELIIRLYGTAAKRVQEAGFDGVEIHGATGCLIVQFLSPRTNQRKGAFGGTLENRMRFPLAVADEVMGAVGGDYPVGYRFLVDEWTPGGLHFGETVELARKLESRGVAYLSATAGGVDVLYEPHYKQQEKEEGFMVHVAEELKGEVKSVPVIVSGRIQRPETANAILEGGGADLIGLARVLFADPQWPKKAAGTLDEPIVSCEHSCSLCVKRAMAGLPAFCSRWDKEYRQDFLIRVKEAEDREGVFRG